MTRIELPARAHEREHPDERACAAHAAAATASHARPAWPAAANAAPAPTPDGGVLQHVLDVLDLGVLLLDGDATVWFANRAARLALREHPALRLHDMRLEAREAIDRARLRQALTRVAQAGGCTLLRLPGGTPACHLALQRLELPGAAQRVLALLERSAPSSALALQWFALACGLTAAEAAVLRRLHDGQRTRDIARAHGVALSTVRTQIGAVRAKTGCGSIRAVIASLSRLPPLGASVAIGG